MATAIIRRGSRCGFCYWALYDGDWCQNAGCAMHGKSVNDNRIHLTNEEAAILIATVKPWPLQPAAK